MIDSSDRDRIDEAGRELHTLIEYKELDNNACILVFANKQDIAGAMTEEEVIDRMNLNLIGDM